MLCSMFKGKDSKLKQPALGRPIKLGALYYGQTDRVAYDENLWFESTLRNNATNISNPSSNFKIRTSNNILDKMKLFNIDGSFSLSLGAGQSFTASLSGSGQYLTDNKEKEVVQSVSMFYESIRDTQFIPQDLRLQIDYPDMCKDQGGDESPTHVVTSVTRGLNAVLEYRMNAKNSSDKSVIIATLQGSVTISSINASGKISLNMTENETRIREEIE